MNTNPITVSEVNFTSVTGQPATLKLHAALTVPSTVSPATLCRLVVPRLPLRPSSSLLFSLLLEEELEGLQVQHTYAELGASLGRGAHTAIRSAAELRGTGLLFSHRSGSRNGQMAFICSPLIRWAETTTSNPIAQDAPERVSTPSATSVPVTARPTTPKATAAQEDAPAQLPKYLKDALEYMDDIVDDHPDWPNVPPNWRGLNDIPLPKDDDIPSMAVPLHVKPWLGPLPKTVGGSYDLDKLLRMPHQLIIASGDDEAIHLFCQEKGDKQTGPVEAAVEEHDVDASEEREAERALEDDEEKAAKSDDDTFSFSGGTEARESDVGHGVPVNPDL